MGKYFYYFSLSKNIFNPWIVAFVISRSTSQDYCENFPEAFWFLIFWFHHHLIYGLCWNAFLLSHHLHCTTLWQGKLIEGRNVVNEVQYKCRIWGTLSTCDRAKSGYHRVGKKFYRVILSSYSGSSRSANGCGLGPLLSKRISDPNMHYTLKEKTHPNMYVHLYSSIFVRARI